MKISIDHPNQDTGYVQENPGVTNITIEEIQKLEDSICTELYVGNVLDYYVNRNDMLVMLAKKIRYGGTLILRGIDLLSVSTLFASGSINSKMTSDMLYSGKHSADTVEDTCGFLVGMGFVILSTNTVNNHYSIVTQRPHTNDQN